MDNNETLELNAIEQAIATDPVNYLNSQPDPRKWTLSTEDIARSSMVGPYDLFSTAQKEPEKYSWVGNILAGFGKGVESMVEPVVSGLMDQALIDEYTYKTPNLPKEDAMRIYEDVMRTSSFIRTRENIEESRKVRNNFLYSLSNGIGSMIALAGIGAITKSPTVVGAMAALDAGYQVKGELIDQYIQGEGTSKGLADKRLEMNAIATAYGTFAGLTEMTIGVERLAAGAINRYAKMNALSRLARMQGKYGKSAAIRAGKEFGTSLAEEAGEEFVQSIGEDIALQGWTDAFTDENFLKAATQAMYGGLIGGPAGAAFYYLGRKQTISKVKEWSDNNKLNLSEQQTMAIADEIIDKGTHQMADQIATMTEINNQFGKAYEVIRARIKETIEATGTTPWTDTGDSSAFDEAWANHEVDKGGTILKFNDKYGTVITITPIVSGKNKGKFQVRAIDRNGRFDMLTEDGMRGNLGQKDENGVAIPWSTKGFDSVQDAYNALKEIYSQPSAESRQAKMDDFVETNAKAFTIPLIMMANVYGMPISDFIEVADLRVAEGTTGKQPMLMFAPISSMEDVERLLEQQKSIIKEQKAAKKLGTERPNALENAERRKAILEIQLERMKQDQKIENARSMRRKQKADYVTAKDLMPTQTTTIDTATQAKEGQEYVMFAGKKIPVEYQVVELADIQPSHINGEPNPNYTNTELQNRASRGTTQDVADLRGKALPENFTPERLTRAPTSAEGAPVINAQGEVIAGNGRAEIVRYAYENPETAEKYKKALRKAGFNIEGMTQPILVRRNTTMTQQEQVAAADLSNISETSAFDKASQARMDSKYLKDSKDSTEFASKLPMSDRRGLMNNNGTWNKRRVQQRYESALLSWLLGNDTKLFESLVLNGRLPQKVIDILVANGAQIYALNDKYPAANIRADIYHALHKMQYASKDNFIEITQQVEMDPRDVMPENVLVWSWLFADSTMARQLLGNYINILEENHDNVNAGADMFGDKVPPLSKKDALMQALKKTDDAKGQLATQKGKDYESLFDPETNEVRNAELASAIASYQNQFAPRPETAQEILNKEQFGLAEENARLDDIYPAYEGETIEVDGKERTVYNSEGKRIAKSAEALTNFWRWFGDSKVVDEQGRPLVVYHGAHTDERFESFFQDATIWATPNKEYAETYRWDKKGNAPIYSLYMKVKNLKTIGSIEENLTDENIKKLATATGIPYQELLSAIDNSNIFLGDRQNSSIWVFTRSKTFQNLAKKYGIDGIKAQENYYGDGNPKLVDTYATFNSYNVKSTNNRGTFSATDTNIYYKKGPDVMGFYDPELQVLVLGKNWDEVTLVHEMHHRYLLKLWEKYQQAKLGLAQVAPAFIEDIGKLFSSLGVTPDQTELTTVQQEKFAYMVEAYLTGFGVDDPNNLAFQGFLHWIPEKVKSIYDLGYLDEQGNIQNPMLDQETIDFFNRWFASPMVPSLPTAPDAQRMVNVANEDGEIAPSEQKVMNNREKDWGQDSERQNKADAQLWQAIGENNPSDLRAALDGEKELMKAEANNNPDDRILPEKPKLRDKWFKTHQPDARELAAEAARAYVAKNPDHARELAFADPETMAEYDAPVDHGMLIRAVMETVGKGSDEWYILDNNLAMVKSMSGSTLSLSGDQSHQAYLDAKREVEEARELKAAVNYAGTRQGAMEKWNEDIRAFAAKRVAAIVATAPNSKEREVAIKAFLEEAKTKFAGNTTNAILNKLDLTGYITKDKGAFVKWAEKQIKEVAHARLDTKEQAELMKASIAAQVALKGINSTEIKDGKYVRAIQSAKDIRHWQYVKDKMKKAYIGRWGRFGIFVDNILGGYMPSAMLMSINTLFFANVPSTAINNTIVRNSAKLIGENKVDENVLKSEKERIKQVFNASGLNLAQMEKPSSPSLMHGEKYTNQEQKHWYNFTFDLLSREDNWFRIPTFVDVLGRIATKNAKGDPKKATELFRQYSELGNKDEDAMVARKQALAVANMAVFTQDGIMASALNHIRSQLNTMSRALAGLEPGGFGIGNLLAPFLKTGTNVIEMGLTATLAPVRTAIAGIKKLQGKEITIEKKIALKTDWTYFAFTVVALAIMAAITSDDDDWYEEPYQTGRRYDPDKPYDSIKIGGVWVKLDIFGPLEVPLRTAAMLVKNWENEKLGALADGMQEAFEEIPLVNQFLDNQMGYMKRKPGDYWRTWGYNQANKLVPAQAKSITRAASRAAEAEWTPEMFEGTNLERKFHRNYGFDGLRLTTNDLLNILSNRIKVGND